MKAAATYTRSSKDRSDGVSIASQDRSNMKTAREMNIPVVAKYSDVVESGKDAFRPDFQRLLADMLHPNREWNTLIFYDTSRLFRGQYLAQAFKHDARKHGIHVVFSTIPDGLDEVSRKMLESQFEVFDEAHSMISKRKGLAGMAENIRNGWRAGGRAPYGYDLEHIETGAYRDGKPVLKSRLVPSADANRMGRFMRLRSEGVPRKRASEKAGVNKAQSTMADMEWNALTYAGHLVWNVCNEYIKGEGYVSGKKRRPRSEWVIKHDTHHALITTEQAEKIIAGLEASPYAQGRRGSDKHLLVGLLKTPAGISWTGEAGKHYRTHGVKPGRWIRTDVVDRAVVEKVTADMQSRRFVRELLKASRKMVPDMPVPGDEMRVQEEDISKRIDQMLETAGNLEDPSPAYRMIDKLECKRKQIARELVDIQREYETSAAIQRLSESDVLKMLQQVSSRISSLDKAALKDILRKLCERILLDPETMECEIHYRIRAEHRINMASPRGAVANPELKYVAKFRLAA